MTFNDLLHGGNRWSPATHVRFKGEGSTSIASDPAPSGFVDGDYLSTAYPTQSFAPADQTAGVVPTVQAPAPVSPADGAYLSTVQAPAIQPPAPTVGDVAATPVGQVVGGKGTAGMADPNRWSTSSGKGSTGDQGPLPPPVVDDGYTGFPRYNIPPQAPPLADYQLAFDPANFRRE